MRVLVTGANGHLGNNLIKALLTRGDKVRASVRSLADAGKTASVRALGNVELVEVDVFRPDQFRSAMDGIDVLFHLAASYAYVIERGREEEQVIRPSVEGAANAIRAAAEARVPKVVLTSSAVTLPLTDGETRLRPRKTGRTICAFPTFAPRSLRRKKPGSSQRR